MKAEEAKREFARKIVEILMAHGSNAINATTSLPDLNALLDEHCYPKEFTNWTHHQDYWHFDIIADMWYSDDDDHLDNKITTDELFNYWKENEQ